MTVPLRSPMMTPSGIASSASRSEAAWALDATARPRIRSSSVSRSAARWLAERRLRSSAMRPMTAPTRPTTTTTSATTMSGGLCLDAVAQLVDGALDRLGHRFPVGRPDAAEQGDRRVPGLDQRGVGLRWQHLARLAQLDLQATLDRLTDVDAHGAERRELGPAHALDLADGEVRHV